MVLFLCSITDAGTWCHALATLQVWYLWWSVVSQQWFLLNHWLDNLAKSVVKTSKYWLWSTVGHCWFLNGWLVGASMAKPVDLLMATGINRTTVNGDQWLIPHEACCRNSACLWKRFVRKNCHDCWFNVFLLSCDQCLKVIFDSMRQILIALCSD